MQPDVTIDLRIVAFLSNKRPTVATNPFVRTIDQLKSRAPLKLDAALSLSGGEENNLANPVHSNFIASLLAAGDSSPNNLSLGGLMLS